MTTSINQFNVTMGSIARTIRYQDPHGILLFCFDFSDTILLELEPEGDADRYKFASLAVKTFMEKTFGEKVTFMGNIDES